MQEFTFPEDVGHSVPLHLPVRRILLVTHYDNPNLDSGKISLLTYIAHSITVYMHVLTVLKVPMHSQNVMTVTMVWFYFEQQKSMTVLV